jgi:hypothetical protein
MERQNSNGIGYYLRIDGVWYEIPTLKIPTGQNPDTQNPEIQNPDKFKIPTGSKSRQVKIPTGLKSRQVKIPTGSKSRNYILLYIMNFCITNFSLLRIMSGPKISSTKIAKYTEFL